MDDSPGITEDSEMERRSDEEESVTSDDDADARSQQSDSSDKPNSSDRSQASTKSFSGSILEDEQAIENGRRYANSDYHMPNDEAEETRLAIVHQAYLMLLDGQLTVHRTPKKRILDIGTGNGDWAIAIGERYPDATVVATDIHSAFQPTNVPSNVIFQIDDARREWTFREPFDFIHIRGLAGAFTDWSEIYEEVYEHLESDGILEVKDIGPIRFTEQGDDSYLTIYNAAVQSAAENAGKPQGFTHLKKELLEQAGFRVVRSTYMEVPIGTWSPDPVKKTVGKMALIAALEGLEARSLRLLTRELGWTAEEVRDLCAKVQAEILRPGAQAALQCHYVVARKLVLTHDTVDE